ncbi:MAG: envelope stress response membrane protein PspC [Halodesulfovibrio sp.]
MGRYMFGNRSEYGQGHGPRGRRCSDRFCSEPGPGPGGYRRDDHGGEWYDHEGRKALYRARDGKVMGVCKGLARYFDVRVRYVRLAFIFAAIFTAFWPVAIIYVLLGLIVKPEPVYMPQDNAEKDFYSAYVGSRSEAVSRLRDKFDRIEKRIRRMENVVTSKEYDWERRFRDHA